MCDNALLVEQLRQVLSALERIPRRMEGIRSPADFLANAEGQDRLDAICMMLVACGEAFKRMDAKTEGKLLSQYPEIEWAGVKGVRDVVAHGYFDIDAEEVYAICADDVPGLIETVRRMISDLK